MLNTIVGGLVRKAEYMYRSKCDWAIDPRVIDAIECGGLITTTYYHPDYQQRKGREGRAYIPTTANSVIFLKAFFIRIEANKVKLSQAYIYAHVCIEDEENLTA